MAQTRVGSMDAEDFLDIVWGDRPGWVDLPAKVGGYWVPFHVHWPADAIVTRRIDSCLRDSESLYFSVAQFKQRGRKYDETMASHWLWADLDEVHPSEAGKVGLIPTMAWQSSPGRYQALWKLQQELPPSTLEKLNQALSYHLRADRGGWDLTQVLRVVGTRNYKYPQAPMVQLLWHHEDIVYDPQVVWRTVRSSYRGGQPPVGSEVAAAAGARRIPRRAAALLRVASDQVVEGERSARLWELECLLAEAGWDEDSIWAAVQSSAWNKYQGTRQGDDRLRREIRKAIRHVSLQRGRGRDDGSRGVAAEQGTTDDIGPQTAGADDRLRREASTDLARADDAVGSEADVVAASPFIRYASFMAMQMEAPRWMIEGLWTQESHGIIGGEPKTGKSILALAMAMSVASGKPFMGWHDTSDESMGDTGGGLGKVWVEGPVLMVQEENAPWVMQDRMRKIARAMGLIGGKEISVDSTPLGGRGGSLARREVTLEFPKEIPFRLLNNYGFDLTDEDHRGLLEREIQEVQPVMVVLDPLYLLLGGVDYDRANQLAPYLKWLLNLRYQYNCAIVLVHHFRKQSGNSGGSGGSGGSGSGGARPGQRILGSTTLHGWAESAMYASPSGDGMSGSNGGGAEVLMTKVEREFRNVGPKGPLEIETRMGEPGDLEFSARIRQWNLAGLIQSIVAQQPGVTVSGLAEQLSMDKQRVLSRVRGEVGLRVEEVKAGRGKSFRVYLAER